ncbi:MAG TPA: hypothetical protein DCY03_21110 [Planctomycetaceae bacterium]|nr:hypothetical protein [Planctomycetaceae bacterium]
MLSWPKRRLNSEGHDITEEISQALLKELRAEVHKRQLSNTENFDRAVLTLSSALLGISLTFIKNVVTLETAICTSLLIISWILLVISIVITLISFHLSQWGLLIQLNNAEKYYIYNDQTCLTKPNIPAKLTDWAAYTSSVSFVFGIIFLVLFVCLNIANEREEMSDQESHQQHLDRGASIPPIQAVPPGDVQIKQGANIPQILQVPPTQPPTTPAQPSGGGKSS